MQQTVRRLNCLNIDSNGILNVAKRNAPQTIERAFLDEKTYAEF